jgi:imidazolonepropionase
MLQWMGGIHTGTIFIRGARQLLTLRGPRRPRCGLELNELNIICDGALLISDGVVVEVGPTRRVENLAAARGAVEISAAGRVVMPGFVDSHTHLVFPLAGADDHDLQASAAAVRAATGKRLAKRVRGYLNAMARHGTTTVEAKTGCGPDESAETKLLRVLKSFHNDPLDIVPTFLFRPPAADVCGEPQAHAAAEWVMAELLPKLRRRRLMRFADFVWEEDPARQAICVRYLETAARLGLSCKMHAERAGAAALEALAAAHPLTSVDHLEEARAEDAAALLRCGGIATLSPTASFHAGARYAPARELIDAGVPVALASNFNPLHTPTLNMQTVVALACLHMRMTPAEAIGGATINGAYAAGCAARAGSLEPGKAADLVILNASDYREMAHPLGMNLVHLTMKRGAFIYQEGEVAPLPAKDLRLAW